MVNGRAVNLGYSVGLALRAIAASFARDPGNVWTNPELTCQHVDPEVKPAHGARAAYEVKVLIFEGSLDAALNKVLSQRKDLE